MQDALKSLAQLISFWKLPASVATTELTLSIT